MRKDVESIGDLPIEYNPENGEFIYTASVGNRKKGGLVGGKTIKGYFYVKIQGKSYPLHRLAFVLMGVPISVDQDVDHINRITGDNRWENLRLVNRSQNAVNSKLRDDNLLRLKNIRRLGEVFQVRVCGKSYGVYKDVALAILVRDEMVREINEQGERVRWTPPEKLD